MAYDSSSSAVTYVAHTLIYVRITFVASTQGRPASRIAPSCFACRCFLLHTMHMCAANTCLLNLSYCTVHAVCACLLNLSYCTVHAVCAFE